MANGRILGQTDSTGVIYTVPDEFSCVVTEIFIVNTHASDIQTYTINVVKKNDTASDANAIAHDVQIQPGYFGDRIDGLNMPLAQGDFIEVDSSGDVTFNIFGYETQNKAGGQTITQAMKDWMAQYNS